MIIAGSVSYTHLDVYKRQLLRTVNVRHRYGGSLPRGERPTQGVRLCSRRAASAVRIAIRGIATKALKTDSSKFRHHLVGVSPPILGTLSERPIQCSPLAVIRHVPDTAIKPRAQRRPAM